MGASLWGPDAREFRPSRWLDLSKSHTSTTKDPNDMKNTTSFNSDSNAGPGVWPNIMTFIDGPRRCVGYKLALMECKILLFTLVRSFTFEPVEGVRIGKWNL
jgi:cytochrome P450